MHFIITKSKEQLQRLCIINMPNLVIHLDIALLYKSGVCLYIIVKYHRLCNLFICVFSLFLIASQGSLC